MRTKRSNHNLKKVLTPIELEQRGLPSILKIDSWQLKVLVIEGLWENRWLVNFAVDIYIYNDYSLMTEYQKLLTQIGRSILNVVLPEKRKIWLCLTFKDRSKGLVLNL